MENETNVFELRIFFVRTVELEFCRIVKRDFKDLTGIWKLTIVHIVEHHLDVFDRRSAQKVDDLFEHIGIKMIAWTIKAKQANSVFSEIECCEISSDHITSDQIE